MEDDSFFDIFEYNDLIHDACDYCIVYFLPRILKDIKTASGLSLNKGDEFEQVTFNMLTQEFQFEVFESCEEHDQRGGNGSLEHKRLVIIPQRELAPFMVW